MGFVCKDGVIVLVICHNAETGRSVNLRLVVGSIINQCEYNDGRRTFEAGRSERRFTKTSGSSTGESANAEYRVFLFQLLTVLGQWDRALTQLNVASELDNATLAMVAMYRQVIDCERFREPFSRRQDPVVFGQPKNGWLCRFRR